MVFESLGSVQSLCVSESFCALSLLPLFLSNWKMGYLAISLTVLHFCELPLNLSTLDHQIDFLNLEEQLVPHASNRFYY